jgi:hypothetical protein
MDLLELELIQREIQRSLDDEHAARNPKLDRSAVEPGDKTAIDPDTEDIIHRHRLEQAIDALFDGPGSSATLLPSDSLQNVLDGVDGVRDQHSDLDYGSELDAECGSELQQDLHDLDVVVQDETREYFDLQSSGSDADIEEALLLDFGAESQDDEKQQASEDFEGALEAVTPDATTMGLLLDSMLEPGINPRLFPVIHASFAAL